MTDPLFILFFSAVTLGAIHTAVGVDHTVPFVVLARTRQWSLARTLTITLACGLGHVLSSAVIAAVGLGFGMAGSRLLAIEETRANIATWSLVALGLSYSAVALFKLTRRKQRELGPNQGPFLTGLFLVFVVGPCEALLPLLTASGLSLSLTEAALVTGAFSGATIGTMLTLVTLGYFGTSFSALRDRLANFERYTHVASGLTLAASGVLVRALGI